MIGNELYDMCQMMTYAIVIIMLGKVVIKVTEIIIGEKK